jgi:L-asparagine transporter-like permease
MDGWLVGWLDAFNRRDTGGQQKDLFGKKEKKKESISLFHAFSNYLQSMPVNDWSSWIFDHFFPMFELTAFAIVAQNYFPDWVRGSNSIVIAHSQL